MSDAFHRDNQTTTSRDVAVLCVYLGLPLIRVQVDGQGQQERISFTVVCKQFDFEIICKEAGSDETSVCFEPLMRANSFVGSKVSYARKSGTWTNFTKQMTPQKGRA